jgi:hypothetical protein
MKIKNSLFALGLIVSSTLAYAYDEDKPEKVVTEGPRLPPGGVGGPGILPIGGSPKPGSCADPTCGGTITKPEPGGKSVAAQKDKINKNNKEKAKNKKATKKGFWQSVWDAVLDTSETVATAEAGGENSRGYIERLLGVTWSTGKVETDEYRTEHKDGSVTTGKRTYCEYEEINEPNRKGCSEMVIRPAPNPDKPDSKQFQVIISRVYHIYAPANPRADSNGYLSMIYQDDYLTFIVDNYDELEEIIRSI